MDMDVDTIGQFQLMYLHHLWCPYSFSAFIVMVHARVARLPKSVLAQRFHSALEEQTIRGQRI